MANKLKREKEQIETMMEMKKRQTFEQKVEEEDPDAVAYIKARKNVSTLHKAKKQMTQIKLM